MFSRIRAGLARAETKHRLLAFRHTQNWMELLGSGESVYKQKQLKTQLGQEDTMSTARRAGPFPKDGATDVVMVFLVGWGEGKCEMAPPFPHQHYTTGSYDLLPWWANLIIKTWTNALAGRGSTLRRWDRVTMLFLPNKEKRHCRSEMFFTELGYFIA